MNLIVTCARHLETETEEELRKVLEEMGDVQSIITITKMSGILTVTTILNPLEVIKKVRERVIEEPWSIRYCLRMIPVQETTETNLESIEKQISHMKDMISEEESYRISIEKRNSDISSQELISRIAKNIKNKVSLEFPDKVVLIEILGNMTGLAIVRRTDILSIEKTKRSLSE